MLKSVQVGEALPPSYKYLHFLGCTRNQYRKIEYAGLRDYLETLFIETEEK